MARKIKTYKRFTIKETTARDKADCKYWIFHPDEPDSPDWECDSLEEAIDWIDSY